MKTKHNGAKRFWLLFAATAALCALFILIFGIRYETNDDAAMANIAAGAFGADSQNLIFSNVLYGWLLKGLRLIAPSVSWYTPAALLLLTLAFAAIGSAFCHRFGNRTGALLWAAAVVLLGPGVWCSLQFTKTAALLIAAGMLVMLCFLGELGGGFLGGAVLALFGSMIRFDLFWPIVAISVCAILPAWLRLGDRKQKIRALAAFAAALIVCTGAQAAGTAILRADPDWAHYMDYNAARAELLDYKINYANDETPFDFYDFGVYEAEYEMLRDWNVNDPDFFTIERYENLSGAIALPGLGQALADYFAALPGLFFSGAGMLFLSALAAALLSSGKKRIWYPLAVAAVTLGGMFLISWAGRLIDRVAFGLLAAAALALLTLIRKDGFGAGKKRAAAYAVVGLLAAVGIASLVPFAQFNRYRIGHRSNMDLSAFAADKDQLYLLDCEHFDGAMGYDVWHAREADDFSNIVFLGGWLTESPFQVDAMEAHGVRNPYRDCVGNSRVLLVESVNIHDVSRYIMLHYDIDSKLTETTTQGLYRVEV